MEAKYYIKLADDEVKCTLCPHLCVIKESKSGVCNVRTNQSGELISENYGLITSIGFDPIEKKPLYHFFPGKPILSIGSLGCNLKCKFCQNWQISQSGMSDFERNKEYYNPEQIVDLAKTKESNIGIAFTYNEPTVFFEFMMDTAILSKKNGLYNVMISNGYINKEPLSDLLKYIDAFNIDLKAFSDFFYKEFTKAQIEPVKETLVDIFKAGKHIEITNLVIPGLNDDEVEFENMIKWITENLDKNVVMHISRYYPSYKMDVEPTSVEKMLKLGEIAQKYLNYVYLGNVLMAEGNNTHCFACNELVIRRSGYTTKIVALKEDGTCMKCGTQILTLL